MIFIVEGIIFGLAAYKFSRYIEKLVLGIFTVVFIVAVLFDPVLYSLGFQYTASNYLISLAINSYCYLCALIGLKFRQ